MFFNAKSSAQFAQEFAAKQRSLKIRRANGGGVPESPPKKPPRTSGKKNESSEFTTGTSSTWLSDRNDKLRTNAITNIQNAIAKQEERKGLVSTTIERLVEVAQARSLCSNERGALLSMKKILACLAEEERLSEIIDALEKLFLDIGSCDIKPEGHKITINKIIAIPVKKKSMSDGEMLKELNKLTGRDEKQRSSVRLDSEKRFC